jgi:DNA ligase (NAD+)
VGPKRAQALVGWLSRNQSLLTQMFEAGVTVKSAVAGVLTGKSVCFTGKMREKRGVLEKMVKDAGGQVKGSVGKGLTYLVSSDPSSSSSKTIAARKNGTRCISEGALLELLRS